MTIPYPSIPPDIIRIGPLALRWYGVMYIVGYAVGIWIARRRVRRGLVPFDEGAVDSLLGYLLVGMLLGARLVYVFVYDRPQYAAHPLDALAIWQGGLSFHGAVLGMATACIIFARRHRVPFWTVADTLALAGTPGLFFGRIGNFINAELYGRPTHVAWAMVFPTDPQRLPRHPSQLYEAIGEGLLLFLLLWMLERLSDGEIFSLIGPNGAGKTTTMECVEGIRRPNSGSITVLGLNPFRDVYERAFSSPAPRVESLVVSPSGLGGSQSDAIGCDYHLSTITAA